MHSGSLLSRERFTVLAFVLGVATALCMLGPGFVFGTSRFWDYPPTDFSSHVIGYRMYLLDGWRFPLFHAATLGDPRGLNLLYMDALPIVALPAKVLTPLAERLPSFLHTIWFNPFGAWLALSYGLQGAFGARLMRELSGRSAVAELAGAVMAIATPVFVLRFVHIALASHFFILAALLLYVQCVRGLAWRRAAMRWTALFAAVTFVHPYLFAMSAGIFAATLATMALRTRAREALLVASSAILTVLALVAVAGFYGAEVTKGGVWGYGYKTTDLISFYTPQWATFFPYPTVHRLDMAHDEAAEGWAYLGLGLLVAIIVTLVRAPRAALHSARRHWIFVLAVTFMAAFAISHRVSIGEKVAFELPLPSALEWPTRQFRACGRFIWPAIYAGTFYVVSLLFRITRATKFAPLVPILAGVQLADALAAMLYAGAYTSRGEARFLDWNIVEPVVREHRAVTFAPEFNCIVWTRPIVAFAQMEVQFMAAKRGLGLSSVRSSRPLVDCRAAPAAAVEAPVSQDRLYLLFPPEVPRATALHFERGGAPCATFPRGMACSTRFASKVPDGFRPFSPDVDYSLGQVISLGREEDERYLGVGWSWREETHRWTDGAAAFLYLRSTEPLPRGARVRLDAAGTVHPTRPHVSTLVSVNGVAVGEVTPGASPERFDLAIPEALAGARSLEIELRPSDVRSPAELDGSEDRRALGLSVRELSILR